MTREIQKAGNWRWRFVLLAAGVVLVSVFALFRPWNIAGLTSQPRPVQTYAEAVQRIETLRAQESPAMNPVCRLQFLTHAQKVARAIVFVHGYTTCPQQFYELAQIFYDLGYNVLSAPLPHHGLADRLTDEQSQLKAEELAAYADEAVDIAQGLGEQVVMVGISAGGVTTSWAAQHRSDLDFAVIISPAFGFKQIPTPLTAVVMNLFSTLPDSFEWWDPVLQADIGPAHAYPRYSRHALTQPLRLGFAVQAGAGQESPAAHTLLVVTNANDNDVNNVLTAEVVENWRAHGADLTTYEFEADLRLGHDLIDPDQPDARIDIVYPVLIDLISGASQ